MVYICEILWDNNCNKVFAEDLQANSLANVKRVVLANGLAGYSQGVLEEEGIIEEDAEDTLKYALSHLSDKEIDDLYNECMDRVHSDGDEFEVLISSRPFKAL